MKDGRKQKVSDGKEREKAIGGTEKGKRTEEKV